eukprot:SAG31_NODE_772_length_12197_cov_7.075963_1_plen_21_part_10
MYMLYRGRPRLFNAIIAILYF